jgi:hypothetical protein
MIEQLDHPVKLLVTGKGDAGGNIKGEATGLISVSHVLTEN